MKNRYTAVYCETITRYNQFFIEADDLDDARQIAAGLEGTDDRQLLVVFEDECSPDPSAPYEVSNEELLPESFII